MEVETGREGGDGEKVGEWNVKVAEQCSAVFSSSYWSHLPPPLVVHSC